MQFFLPTNACRNFFFLQNHPPFRHPQKLNGRPPSADHLKEDSEDSDPTLVCIGNHIGASKMKD